MSSEELGWGITSGVSTVIGGIAVGYVIAALDSRLRTRSFDLLTHHSTTDSPISLITRVLRAAPVTRSLGSGSPSCESGNINMLPY